ncbi:MAG: hypothetical protein ACOC6J_00170 [Spirochaetota bacterium]
METVGSLIFLAFLVLLPLAMVVLLVVLLVKRRDVARTWRESGARIGFAFLEPDSPGRARFADRIGETLFTLHPRSDHDITHALEGEVDGHGAWVAYAQTVNKAAANQRHAVTRMTTCVAASGLDEILLVARPTNARLGASLLEHAGGLVRPDSERWSWAITNDPAILDDLDPATTTMDALRSLLQPGDSLVVFPELLVHLRQLDNSLHTGAIGSYIEETPARARALTGLSRSLSRVPG